MIQFLNNIWIALSSENSILLSIFAFPLNIIETYLSMNIFLIIFNVKASKNQVLWYILSTSIISVLNANFIPTPFNVILNYICIIVFRYLFL